MKKALVLISVMMVSVFAMAVEIPLSLSHLDSLKWDFRLNSRNVTAWWVYSNPDLSDQAKYVNVPAPNEGAVCVDDASRAVILYLRLYRESGNRKYLETSKGGLEFLMAMEGNDGEFYNFVYSDGKINEYGVTSKKSVSWWTVRGFWALSAGAEIFKSVDPKYSADLMNHAELAYGTIKGSLQNGLVQGYSDVSSVFLLGLSEMYSANPDPEIASTAAEVADAIVKTQSRTGFMKGAFFTSNDMYYWNGWGARQVQALALAGKIFENAGWIKAAEYAALNFYPKLILSLGPVYAINGSVAEYSQISYADEVMVSGLTQLYLSTGKKLYANLAYTAASWYFRNNNLGEAMYSSDGKGFDGLEEYFRNINSGAESTICADLSLSDLMELPASLSGFLGAKRVFENGITVLNASKMYSGFGGTDTVQDGSVGNGAYLVMKPYSTLSSQVEVKKTGKYDVYLSLKNSDSGGKLNLYFGNSQYSFSPETNRRFELVKALSGVELSSGKTNAVIEYVNGSGSAKIDVAQIVIVPDIIEQTVSTDGTHNLTAVFNDSTAPVDLSKTADGTPTSILSYSDEGRLTNGTSVPRNGFGFVEWNAKTSDMTAEKQAVKFQKTKSIAESKNFSMLDISEFFNNSGMVSDNSSAPANFDNPSGNAGGAYPIGPLSRKIENGLLTTTIDGSPVPFYLGALKSDTPDNMTFQGQNIGIPGGKYGDLFILGASDHGNYVKVLKLYYSDGSSEEVSVGFGDWYLKPLPGEWTAFAFPYGLTTQMQRATGNPKLYVQRIRVNDSKDLIGIGFPLQITMHLFAITLSK